MPLTFSFNTIRPRIILLALAPVIVAVMAMTAVQTIAIDKAEQEAAMSSLCSASAPMRRNSVVEKRRISGSS